MMRRSLSLLVMSSLGGVAAVVACSSSSSPNAAATDSGTGDTATEAGGGNFAVEVPCTDSVDSVYGDPGTTWQSLPKGGIIKCHKDPDIAKADLQATASAATGADGGAPGYPGQMKSGAHVYRVLYRTERGDTAASPGYSSATVYVPDTPHAAKLPVIAAAHGSRGQAAKCAPSKNDPAAADVEPDYYHLVYPLVGAGYAVIVTDLPGYANYGAPGNPPSAYANAADVGKGTLDSARALRAMFSQSLNGNVVLTGHSQGGGSALAALAISDTYGSGGTVVGVAVYAPLWLPARAYGALLLAPGSYPIGFDDAPPIVSLWYHYTVAELLDGQGHGIDLFQASKQSVVKSFVDNDCWTDHYPDLNAAAMSDNELFDPAYANAIKGPAAGLGGGDCGGNALCQKWMDRFNKERPHLTGNAAQVPILLSWGGQDTTMKPDFMSCVFDRLGTKGDNANYKVCYDPSATHGSIVALQADHVIGWIAAKSLGEAMPADCKCD